MRSTEQEDFWEGEFGTEYIDRNVSKFIDASNINLFCEIFNNLTSNPESIFEFGANIGNNLKAIKNICPGCKTIGAEINPKAVEVLEKTNYCDVVIGDSIFNIEDAKFNAEITMTKGVLIHINPDYLSKVYEKLYRCSKKYILIIEYYNPSPVEVNYRGYTNKLFKRDFAGEIMDKYKNLQLIKYGFRYRRDNLFPLDDLSWFLLSK